MKNITNAYLVLSIADIRAMLHAAELEQRVRGETRETVTIVLNDLVVLRDTYGDAQICTASLRNAVDCCVAMSNEDLDGGYSARARAGETETPMNDSDAAI